MKHFQDLEFNSADCRSQTRDLRKLLATKRDLNERKDILPFFRDREHLSALCGIYNTGIIQIDRIAWEFDLSGDFYCDLVVGDSTRKNYSFIEFEDAGPKSLFVRKGKKASRDWSSRFDRGFSQIIDWFYKLDDLKNSDAMELKFGKRSIHFMGILIIGRDQFFQAGERLRFNWRRDHVIVQSRKIICITFDELLRDLTDRLEFLPSKPSRKAKEK